MDKTTSEKLYDKIGNRFAGLSAALVNTTLKHPEQESHTNTLMDLVEEVFTRCHVKTDRLRLTEYDVAPGVAPDMTEEGWESDAWTEISDRIIDPDILIVGSPIWLGQMSSQCKLLIERLYGHSDQTNDDGQYIFYNKVGGCVITGNEDGVKHVAMETLYSLQHLGYTVPPQADCGWIGEVGPGPSYGDEKKAGKGRVGFDNEFTRRNTTFMAFNCLHMAHLLKTHGIPAEGNVPNLWDDGTGPGWPNPEYRSETA